MEKIKRRNSSIHNFKETYKIIKGCDEEGLATVNQYSLERKLGSGSSGKVKLAIKKNTNEKFAIKILKKNCLKHRREFVKEDDVLIVKNAFQDLLREIAIMKKLNHPNVIKLYEVLDDPEEDKMYLILDYAENGQLLEWNQNENCFKFTKPQQDEFLSENELRRIFRDIVKGLFYLHNNGIVHRDLKPQNILFDENYVAKIADFGVSLKLGKNKGSSSTCAGTFHFMCPESGNSSPLHTEFSAKNADIWALGVTLYCFTFQKVPFDGETVLDILTNIEEKKLEFPSKRIISKELQNLMERLMEKNPSKRITLNEIIEDDWMNMSCSDLKEEINKLQVMISESDIENALLPLHTIVFIKTMVSRWRKRSLSRSKSPLAVSEGSSPTITGGLNYKPRKLSTYGKANNILTSKLSIELNEIIEDVSQKQIISHVNSPSNSQNKINDNINEIDNNLESTVDNLTNNSSGSKKERTIPTLQILDFNMKYLKKNSDGNFLNYTSEK